MSHKIPTSHRTRKTRKLDGNKFTKLYEKGLPSSRCKSLSLNDNKPYHGGHDSFIKGRSDRQKRNVPDGVSISGRLTTTRTGP